MATWAEAKAALNKGLRVQHEDWCSWLVKRKGKIVFDLDAATTKEMRADDENLEYDTSVRPSEVESRGWVIEC